MYNFKHMGSILAENGKTPKKVDYLIYNIDNIYTVYIQTGNQPNPSNPTVLEPIFSAVASFDTLKKAKDYVASI